MYSTVLSTNLKLNIKTVKEFQISVLFGGKTQVNYLKNPPDTLYRADTSFALLYKSKNPKYHTLNAIEAAVK